MAEQKKIKFVVKSSSESESESESEMFINCNIDYQTIRYNNLELNPRSIDFFNTSTKNDNDEYNKYRETIIEAIINKKIPEIYFTNFKKWDKLRLEIFEFIKKVWNNENKKINSISCVHKAGRMFNYDFEIKINNVSYKIEFKFNAKKITDAPQFSSPGKPSKFLDISFEEYFYDNYLLKISEFGKLPIPNRDVYLKTVHNNFVECLLKYKEKYNNNIEFNRFCKKIDKEAINNFIKLANLNITELSRYLTNSQKDKIYMCYSEGKFYLDKFDSSIYNIKYLEKKTNVDFICVTEKGYKIEVKLRFKNGCGLQYPAFQIKRKIPDIKVLKELCKKNNIILPNKFNKCDIEILLDSKKIIY
jgi:hypothetical protein